MDNARTRKLILDQFSKGISVKGIVKMVYNTYETEEKDKKIQSTDYVKQKVKPKEVQREVETILLDDYLTKIKSNYWG